MTPGWFLIRRANRSYIAHYATATRAVCGAHVTREVRVGKDYTNKCRKCHVIYHTKVFNAEVV